MIIKKVLESLKLVNNESFNDLLNICQTLMEMGIPASQIVFLNFENFELRKFLNDLDGLYEHIIGILDLSF